MSEIKIDQQYDEPWKVMKAASEGKRVAINHHEGLYTKIKQPSWNWGGDNKKYAIIDDSQPEIDWDGFDWEFFNQYGGLPVRAHILADVTITGSEQVMEGIELRESPWYPWFGGECPVPKSVEVEIEQVTPHTMKTICRDKYIMSASEVEWYKSTIIAFRLTGRVL